MVRRTRKRSKNKKGGADTSFTGKFLQGANDIGDGLKAARRKAEETYTGAQQGIKDFKAAAEEEKRRLAQGGTGGRYSPVFEGMMKKKLELPASKIALQRAARDKGASTDYSNPNPLLSPMKRKRAPLQEGGKRKTRRKKRRKNKRRKTKKRRRKRKTKKKRRR